MDLTIQNLPPQWLFFKAGDARNHGLPPGWTGLRFDLCNWRTFATSPFFLADEVNYIIQVWQAEGTRVAQNHNFRIHKSMLGCREWSVLPAFIVIFISRLAKTLGWKRLSRRILLGPITTGMDE
jgi:hypothetical protein